MDLVKVEEEVKKIVESLDKGTRLEAVIKEEGEYRVVLSKGVHSDRAARHQFDGCWKILGLCRARVDDSQFFLIHLVKRQLVRGCRPSM